MTDFTEIRASVDALTSKTTETLTAMQKDISVLSDETGKIQAVLKRPGFGGAGNNDAEQGLKAELSALASLARTGRDTDLREICASMSTGSDPDGGYLVPPNISSGMTKKLWDLTPMRQLARVETIATGNSWDEPIDYDEVGAVWVGENTARPATTTAKMKMLSVALKEIYALQPVTQNLLDDVGFDLGGWINGKITDKFARSEDVAFLTGDGVTRPRGLLTYDLVATTDATRPWGTLQYIPSGAASDVTADSLRNMTWGLRAPYRAGAVWLMNSNTAAVIDKLKDATGRYLWRDALVDGNQPTILGYPVVFDESMPDIGAGSTPIAFGNFKLAYVIVDRTGIKFMSDPYSDKPRVQFYAYKRVGGGLANSEALKLMKVGTA